MTLDVLRSTARLIANPQKVRCGFGRGTVLIAWSTGDGSVGEVYVLEKGRPERLFCTGDLGVVAADWIAGGVSYEFRLYGPDRTTPLRTVQVVGESSSDGMLDQLILPALKHRYPDNFRLWQDHAVHLTPVSPDSPIPDTRTLPDDLFSRESELAGIDLNLPAQLELLKTVFPRFRAECDAFPSQPSPENPAEFHLGNGQFDGSDALACYCMVRHFQPRLIIAAGAGFTTRLLAKAALANGNTELACIHHAPDETLRRGIPGLTELFGARVQDIPLSTFARLGPGDFLVIDSSHVARIGSDVNHLFLEVLPRLNPGVIVQFTNIYLPCEYPRNLVVDQLHFWNEQYLLQTFLAFNNRFQVLFANHLIARKHPAEFQQAFPNSPRPGGVFWIQRRQP